VLTVEYLSRIENEGDGVVLRCEQEFSGDLQTVIARAQAIANANSSVQSVVVRYERGYVEWAWVSPAALAAPWHLRKRRKGVG
jgi:hypothetical protein